MKIVIMLVIVVLSAVSCTSTETKVKINKLFKYSVILNAHGNVMTLTALLFAILYANPLNVILHVLNQKMLFAMLNVKNLNAK